MMYGYNGSDSWSGMWAIGMHFHMFFGLLLFFGLLAGVAWLFRFAKEAQLKKILWITLLVGAVGTLFTAPMAYWGMENMMEGWRDSDDRSSVDESEYVQNDDEDYRGMMDWYFDQEKTTDTSTEENTAQ